MSREMLVLEGIATYYLLLLPLLLLFLLLLLLILLLLLLLLLLLPLLLLFHGVPSSRVEHMTASGEDLSMGLTFPQVCTVIVVHRLPWFSSFIM